MARSTVILVAVALGLLTLGCNNAAPGQDNATAINQLKAQGQVNTDPNAAGAVQPRDITGNPIGTAPAGNKLGKVVPPAQGQTTGATPPSGGGQ